MTTEWKRYYFEDDEVKVEMIDPRTVYYEIPDERMVCSVNDDRRFMVIKAGINDWRPDRQMRYHWKPREGWTPNAYSGPVPHGWGNPLALISRTPIANAVKIALDGSVN